MLVGDRNVYTGVRGIPRGHGHWRSHFLPHFLPGQPTFEEALNKDWSGRPKYQDAGVPCTDATVAAITGTLFIATFRKEVGTTPSAYRRERLA